MKKNTHAHNKNGYTRIPCVEPLEQRVLFSADISPFIDAASEDEPPGVISDTLQSYKPAVTELVVLDRSVADSDLLLADIQQQRSDGRELIVIEMDGDTNGVDAITRALTNSNAISAIHIVSHGTDQRFAMGNHWLDLQTFEQQKSQIASWGNSLAADGDILIYGCNLAENADGQSLLNAIAQSTGADAAASKDRTGHRSLLGDWDLEFSTGTIEAQPVLSDDMQDYWQNQLAAVDANDDDLGPVLTNSSTQLNPILLSNDTPDPDSLRVVNVISQNPGTITQDNAGQYTYMPDSIGADTFEYIIAQSDQPVFSHYPLNVDSIDDNTQRSAPTATANDNLPTFNSTTNSYDFDGNDYVEVPVPTEGYGQTFTIAFDFRPGDPQDTDQTLFQHGTYTNSNIIKAAIVKLGGDNYLKLTLSDSSESDSSAHRWVNINHLYSDSEVWHNLAITHEPGSPFRVHLDGQDLNLYDSSPRGGDTIDPNGPINIGRYINNGGSDGDYLTSHSVKDVRIYNEVVGKEIFYDAQINYDTALVSATVVDNLPPQFQNAQGTESYVMQSAPVVIDTDFSISDPELKASSNYDGTTLTLQRSAAQDYAPSPASEPNAHDWYSSATHDLTGPDLISPSAITFGSIVTNSGGQLSLAFNSLATDTLINDLVQSIEYRNTANWPADATDWPHDTVTLQWTFDDAGILADGSQQPLKAAQSTTHSHIDITTLDMQPAMVRNNNLVITVGASDVVVDNSLFMYVDVDTADDNLEYTITDIPASLKLKRDGIELSEKDAFTQEEINLNRISVTSISTTPTTDTISYEIQGTSQTGSITVDIVSNGPSQLQTGLQLNTDGDNNAYLKSTSGYNLLIGSPAITMEFVFSGLSPNSGNNESTLYSTFVDPNFYEYLVIKPIPDSTDGILQWYLRAYEVGTNAVGEPVLEATVPDMFATGMHSIALAVENGTPNGAVHLYHDGQLLDSGTHNLLIHSPIYGTPYVVGQKLTSTAYEFDQGKHFSGTIHNIRLWGELRSDAQLVENKHARINNDNAIPGGKLLADWHMNDPNGLPTALSITDTVIDGNTDKDPTLLVSHATGPGYVSSVVSDEFIVKDNTPDSPPTVVGYVRPADPTPDPGGYTYEIVSGEEASAFSIDATTGAITLSDSSQLVAGETQHILDVRVTGTESPDATYTQSITIRIATVNEAPVINDLIDQPLYATNNLTPILLDPLPALTLTDPNQPADFDGGMLMVTGSKFEAEDQLGIDTNGVVGLSTTTPEVGTDILVSGVVIGNVSVADNNQLQINLNTKSNLDRTQSLLRSISFATDSTLFGHRSVDYTLNDGDGTDHGGSDSLTQTVDVFVGLTDQVSIDEDETHVFVASDFNYAGFNGVDAQTITIRELPQSGVLLLKNNEIDSTETVVTTAQILAGDLIFVPAANLGGNPLAYFAFSVNPVPEDIDLLAGDDATNQRLDSNDFNDAKNLFKSHDLFHPDGIVKSDLHIHESTDTIDADYLSNGPVLFSGNLDDGELTASELSSIDDWVENGGVLITMNDSSAHDDLSSFYGLTVQDNNNREWTVTDNTHPIMNGPFGIVSGPLYGQGAYSGTFDPSTLAANDTVLARDIDVATTGDPTVILRKQGAGSIVFLADEGVFRANINSNHSIDNENERFLANLAAWAIQQNQPAKAIHKLDINVNAINDNPQLSLGAPVTVTENIPQLIMPLATVADPDTSSFNGAVLTVQLNNNTATADTLTLASRGSGIGQINVSGSQVEYEGVPIGSYIAGNNGTTALEVTFNASADQASIQAILQAVSYYSAEDNPASSKTVDVQLSDGSGGSTLQSTSFTILPVNDAPTINITEVQGLEFVENGPAVIASSTLVLADDGSTITSASVQISDQYQPGKDKLLFTPNSSTGAITGNWNNTTATLSLTIASGASGTIAEFQEALRQVSYVNTAENTHSATRTLTYLVNDGELESTPATHSVEIVAVNDAPVFHNLDGTTIVLKNDGVADKLNPDNLATITDIDDPDNFSSGTLTITITGTSFKVGDRIGVDSNTSLSFSKGYNANSIISHLGTPFARLSFVNDSTVEIALESDSTLARVEALIHNTTFESTSESTNSRAVVFNLVDGSGKDNNGLDETTATVDVYVGGVSTIEIVEDNNHAFHTSDFTFTGYNESQIKSITIVSHTSSNPILYNNIPLTGSETTITADELNAGALRYEPAANTSTITPDSFTFSVNTPMVLLPGNSSAFTFGTSEFVEASNVLTNPENFSVVQGTIATDIAIASMVDDINTNYLNGGDILFNGFVPDGEVSSTELATIDNWIRNGGNILVSSSDRPDVDDINSFYGLTTLAGRSNNWNVVATNHPIMDGPFGQVEPRLSLGGFWGGKFDTDSLDVDDIVLAVDETSFNPTLVLRALDKGYALFSSDEALFRTYLATDGEVSTPSSRFLANLFAWIADQQPPTVYHTQNITVLADDDAPEISNLEMVNIDYTNNDGTAVPLTGEIIISDIDSAMIDHAVVSVTNGFQVNEDKLTFTNTSAIHQTWDAMSGTLTLTGPDTVANFEQALRSIGYQNLSDNANLDTRTVSFSVHDGNSASSRVSRQIDIENLAPVITANNSNVLNYTNHGTLVAVYDTLEVSDEDNTIVQSAQISFTAGYNGSQDKLAFTDTTLISSHWNEATSTLSLSGLDSVEHYQAALRSVAYQNTSNNPDLATRSVSFQVNDGDAGSNVNTRSIEIQNLAPVLAGNETSALVYSDDGAQTPISATITVSDPDNTIIQRAVVSISSGYNDSQDLLSFTDTATVHSNWNAATGTLTLNGADTVTNYEAALRAVSYQNAAANADLTTRIVSYQVNDGWVGSTTVDRHIEIQNQQPILSAIESNPLFYTDDGAQTPVSDTIVASDADNTIIHGAAISVSNGYNAAHDVLSFTDTLSITSHWDSVTGTLSLSGADTIANYESALRSVAYQNSDDNPDLASRTVSFQINDGAIDSETVLRTIEIENQPPVLSTTNTTTLTYSADGTPVPVFSNINVSDADNTLVQRATVSFESGYIHNEDHLAFTDTSAITAVWDTGIGKLVLNGADTVANYQAALRFITYQNLGDNPDLGSRTVSILVNDGILDSNLVVRDIEIQNLPPQLQDIETYGLLYTESSVEKPITETLQLNDSDNTQIHGATVSISAGYQPSEDQLTFTNTSTITGNWDSSTGTLTLNGTDTLANYQSALHTVSYLNSSENMAQVSRSLSFQISDGTSDSNVAVRAITTENHAPQLSTTETSPLLYTDHRAKTRISSDLQVSDVDNTMIHSATVWFSSGYNTTQDKLAFDNLTGITGSWDTNSGALILSGSDTVANYQATLRSISYQNTGDNPELANRTVSYKISDGNDDSNLISRVINIENGAPKTSGIELEPLIYTDDGKNTPVSATIEISDDDNTLIASASVAISSGYNSTEDQLTFTDTSQISGSWNATTGTLVLTGSDTVANYQAALRAIAYLNSADNPDLANRTVSYKISDGNDDSTLVSRVISIANSAPQLFGIEPESLIYTVNGQQTPVSAAIRVSDDDNTLIAGASAAISGGYNNTEDQLTVSNTTQISGTWNTTSGTLELTGADTLANYQTALRSITYQNSSDNPDLSNRTVTYIINDGKDDSNPASRVISIDNSTPQISGIESAPLIYTENGGPATVSATIQVSDDDNTLVAGANVMISSGYQFNEDQLTYSDTIKINGDWNATSATLTLTGLDTVANYQQALRSIAYENSGDNPELSNRTVTFIINDGNDDSNPLSRAIGIHNSTPQLSAIESEALRYTNDNGQAPVSVTIQLSDEDNTLLTGASVTISGGYVQTEDQLTFSNTTQISGNWNVNSGTLQLSGSDSVSNYQAALRSVTYINTSDNPELTSRTVSFQISDGDQDSELTTRLINIEIRAPQLSAIETDVLLYNNHEAGIAVSNNLQISDVNNTLIQFASVSIVQGYNANEDQLVFSNNTMITGHWDTDSGVLTLTGSDTLENYQTALRSIAYQNTADNPFPGNRTIAFQINDGIAASESVNRVVEINNNAPELSEIEADTLIYAQSNDENLITESIQVSDTDNTLLHAARVSIVEGYRPAEDQLSFSSTSLIIGNWDTNTGVLTLSGVDTVENYQLALRSIIYQNLSATPDLGSRSISYQVNDGIADSQLSARDILVNIETPVPTLNNIPDHLTTAGEFTTVELPADLFTNPVRIVSVDIINIADGSTPLWLNYDAESQTLSGTASEPGSYEVRIITTYNDALQVYSDLTVIVEPAKAAAETVEITQPTLFITAITAEEQTPLTSVKQQPAPATNLAMLTDVDNVAKETPAPNEPQTKADRLPDVDRGASTTIESTAYKAKNQPNRELQVEQANKIQLATVDQVVPLSELFSIESDELDQRSQRMKQTLDDANQEIENRSKTAFKVTTSVTGATASLSIGYIVWLLRGGVLLSSVLSTLPAWRTFDPLPVLSSSSMDDDAEDDESLKDMVKQKEAAETKDKDDGSSELCSTNKP